MSYINGAIIPVPNQNKSEYIQHAKVAGEIFKDNGALEVVDCWGDDVKEGKLTSFPQAVKLQEGESVVFSWIMWPSKEAAEKGMEKAMEDERWEAFDKPPFDGKRMIFGSFDVL